MRPKVNCLIVAHGTAKMVRTEIDFELKSDFQRHGKIRSGKRHHVVQSDAASFWSQQQVTDDLNTFSMRAVSSSPAEADFCSGSTGDGLASACV